MRASALEPKITPRFPAPVEQAVHLFDQCFLARYHTRLRGGLEEPLYQPGSGDQPYTIWFTRDYFASALHEVAHWCIAGPERRQREDYGYWYQPDGRDSVQQRLFERVEVKPQALEWVFSRAAAAPFRLSADNLSGDGGLSEDFKRNVHRQARAYAVRLPDRAQRFAQALSEQFGGVYRDPANYRLEDL